MKPHPRKTSLALFLIIAAAALARLFLIGHHLPALAHIEEKEVAWAAAAVAGGASPGTFVYPALLYYLLVPLVRAGAFFSGLTGWEAQASVILAARYLSLAAGLISLVLVYRIGRKLLGEPGTGLLAAAFLAADQLHAYLSCTAKPDMLMTALALASVLFSCRVFSDAAPRLRDYILAGACAGLAAAAKYNGGFVIAALFAAHFLSSSARNARGGWLRLLAASCVTLTVFFSLNPYILLDRASFLRDFGQELVWAGTGFARNGAAARGWISYPSGLAVILGAPLLIVSLCGIAAGMLRRRKELLLLLAFPVVYYAVMGWSNNTPVRYLFPVIPLVLLPAAWFTLRLRSAALSRGLFKKTKPLFSFLLIALIIMPSVQRLARFSRWIGQEDTRLAAREWIERNAAPGASVLIDGVDDRIPFIFGKERVPLRLRVISWEPELARRELGEGPFDLVVVAAADRPAAMLPIYRSIEESYSPVKEFRPRFECPPGPFRGNGLYHPSIMIYQRKAAEVGG